MAFKLTEKLLSGLFAAAHYAVPDDDIILVGIRGCIPIDSGNAAFTAGPMLEYVGTDYLHMRCTIAIWRRGKGIMLFPASTVPYRDQVRAGIAKGGAGVNQLALGFYHGAHGYARGAHKVNEPNRRHRALRNESILPVWRTADDADYDGDDRLFINAIPYDNMHCGWQMDPAAPYYSSNGCQVIAGRPQVLARDWGSEEGAWKRFIEHIYGAAQTRFAYALFSGREVLRAATLPANEGLRPSVRFGSSGPLAEIVQDALIKRGYPVGAAGSDGDFGLSSAAALARFQRERMSATSVDAVAGAATGAALGIDWPTKAGELPPLADWPVDGDNGTETVVRPASAGPAGEAGVATPNYRSLTPGGFFSATPFDLSIKRAIRTNNPGALNISAWQRIYPGFAGVTQPDHAGNVTAIYVTPEHGVAAWHYLFTSRYGFGEQGSVVLQELVRRYAGVPTVDHPAAQTYVRGWTRASGTALKKDTLLSFADDASMLPLAKAMFAHEIGAASPLKDAQILKGLALKRSGTLPKA
jgi:hypothetical protein